MGSITFQVVGDASVGTKSKTFQLSDATINRMVEWGKELHRVSVGTPSPGVPEALSAWGEHLMDVTEKGTRTFEHDQARFALPPPPPFVVTE